MSETTRKRALRAYTIGHSTHSLDRFLSMLRPYQINLVVDIRTVPRSRHNPQYNKEVLPLALRQRGVRYLHMPGLGGLRRAQADSANRGWRNTSFRGFADYMQTPEFESAMEELMEAVVKERLVLMCAESLPWRCHRSLVADALLVRGVQVVHLFERGDSLDHTLTHWAQIEGTRVFYPEAEPLSTSVR